MQGPAPSPHSRHVSKVVDGATTEALATMPGSMVEEVMVMVAEGWTVNELDEVAAAEIISVELASAVTVKVLLTI